jgi:hypothetical protein
MALPAAGVSAGSGSGIGAAVPAEWPGNTPNTVGGVDYYVDYTGGYDGNSGTSTTAPWKTLAKVSATTFSPGDRILLKAGETWQNEQLWPKGSGAAGQPIVIDVYGDNSAGRPYIAANGATPCPFSNGCGQAGQPGVNWGTFTKDPNTIGLTGAVVLRNQEYWEIHNLEISNDADFDSDIGANYKGVYDGISITINADLFQEGTTAAETIMDYFRISNNYIHDTDGTTSWQQVHYGGICFQVFGANRYETYMDSAYYFRDVRIENNTIIKTELHAIQFAFNWFYDRYGGCMTGMDEDGKNHECWEQVWVRQKDLFSRDVYIGHNYAESIGQGAIQLANTDNMTVEYNEINGYLKRYTSVSCGLYLWAGQNSTMQYNEVYGAAYAQYDGSPWDLEYTNYNVTYQFNYSHDNGAGWMSYMGNSKNSIARYNLSVNENGVIVKNMLSSNYREGATFFTNNIFIYDGAELDYFHDETMDSPVYFLNNVFYNVSETTTTPWTRLATGIRFATFSNNAFYEASGTYAANQPRDPNAVYGYPGFVSDWTEYKQGEGVLNIQDSAAVFKLRDDSILIDAGRYDTHLGTTDFFGTGVYYGAAPDIGIHEVVQGGQVTSPVDPEPISAGSLAWDNILEGAAVTATSENPAHLAAGASDKDFLTYWQADAGATPSATAPVTLEFDMGEPKTFNLGLADEWTTNEWTAGSNRTRGYQFQYQNLDTGAWATIASSNTGAIGRWRWLAPTAPITAQKVRVNILGLALGSPPPPAIRYFGLFNTATSTAVTKGLDDVALLDVNTAVASLATNQAELRVELDGATPESGIRLADASGALVKWIPQTLLTIAADAAGVTTYTVPPAAVADVVPGAYTATLVVPRSSPIEVDITVVDSTELAAALDIANALPVAPIEGVDAFVEAREEARAVLASANRDVTATGNSSVVQADLDQALGLLEAATGPYQAAVEGLDLSLQVSPRCVAGKVTLTVAATNAGATDPVSLTITSTWGAKSFASVAPAAKAQQAISTKQAAIPAGSVAVTGAAVGNPSVTGAAAFDYPAFSCAG